MNGWVAVDDQEGGGRSEAGGNLLEPPAHFEACGVGIVMKSLKVVDYVRILTD